MRGYKVFNPDWTCRGFKFEVGKTYEEKGKPVICEKGFHFCKELIYCFNYYDFDPNNKVAEIEATGLIDYDSCGKYCTNEIHIIRELTWYEVLDLANLGFSNKGYGNVGNHNKGNHNTGNHNIGDRNTGVYNEGYRNSGSSNIGEYNTGNNNMGEYNTGYHNFGDYNSNSRNSGNYNSGYSNNGNYNSGHFNFGSNNSGGYNIGHANTGESNRGHYNTGDFNFGNYNTGEWNKTDYSSGCFCTEEQKINMFNKPSNWTRSDWLRSEARDLLSRMSMLKWIPYYEMTDKEKSDHPEYIQTKGYLKRLDIRESAREWWNYLSDREKAIIKLLPNFDPDIFEQITGIKIDN